jgi:hypothetical protein
VSDEGESVAVLDRLLPAAEQSWKVLFQLSEARPRDWCLLGGQMMYLLAVEAGRTLPRPTDDVDVVVDVRARQGSTEWLAAWLLSKGLELEGISPEGIGHRFVRDVDPPPGRIIFDVLAPEGLGERTNTYTVRPAKTVQAPGTSQALRRSESVVVTITGPNGKERTVGRVRRPTLLGALVCKAATTTISVRTNPERDWQDAALALSLIVNPLQARRQCDPNDLSRIKLLRDLLDLEHFAWEPLSGSERELGVAALNFLLREEN